jgi:hypothetical protein
LIAQCLDRVLTAYEIEAGLENLRVSGDYARIRDEVAEEVTGEHDEAMAAAEAASVSGL